MAVVLNVSEHVAIAVQLLYKAAAHGEAVDGLCLVQTASPYNACAWVARQWLPSAQTIQCTRVPSTG